MNFLITLNAVQVGLLFAAILVIGVLNAERRLLRTRLGKIAADLQQVEDHLARAEAEVRKFAEVARDEASRERFGRSS